MKVALAQFIVILVLSGGAGVAYNTWLESSSPEKHLEWVDRRYEGFDLRGAKAPEPAPARESTPAAEAPAEGAKVAPEPPAGAGTQGSAGKAAKADPPAPAPAAAPPAGEGDFRLIGLDAATEEYRAGTVFLDARRSRDYELGHIPGARPMSAHEGDLLEKIAKLRDEEPLEAPIVIYCTNSKDCEDSKIVGRQLKEVGFLDISIYQGGFPEWEKEKRPVARGKDPGTREEP